MRSVHFYASSPIVSMMFALLVVAWSSPDSLAAISWRDGIPPKVNAYCSWSTGFEGRGPDGRVLAMTVFDDGDGPALYVGGEFVTAGDQFVRHIAKWDGERWSPLGFGVNWYSSDTGRVEALAVYDDGTGPALYAAGFFSHAGDTEVQGIAKWDGESWSALGSGTDGTQNYALAVFDDGEGSALYLGGGFDTAGDATVNGIAKWDGVQWTSLGTGVDGEGSTKVQSLTVYDDGSGPALFAGGDFTTAGEATASHIAKWDGSHWTALGSGLGGSSPDALTLAVHDDGTGEVLFVGGDFGSAGGIAAENIAKWNGLSWSAVGAGLPSNVAVLAVFDDGNGPRLVAGGWFVDFQPTLDRIAAWNGTTWRPLGSGVDHAVEALAVYNDGRGEALYVGGRFGNAGGIPVDHVAKWQDSTWSALGVFAGQGLDDQVRALAEHDDGTGATLYAAGDFQVAGGVAASRIARWDGIGWSPVGTGFDGDVYALARFDDGSGMALYAAGSFRQAGGLQVGGIARWDGDQWLPVGSVSPRDIFALAVHDDGSGPALYAGGDQGTGGLGYLAKWDGTSWTSVGGSKAFDGRIFALASYSDGMSDALVAGGEFKNPDDGVARWNGTAWSALGDGLGRNSVVHALAAFDDGDGMALYASIEEDTQQAELDPIARFDGVQWTEVGLGLVDSVRALTVYDDSTGRALYAGTSSGEIARWVGTGWDPLYLGTNDGVQALANFNSGDPRPGLYAGGTFTMADGLVSHRIAAWYCMPIADLAITLTNGSASVVPGATTTYTLVVTNSGPSNEPGATVTANPPASLSGCAWECEATGGALGCRTGTGNLAEELSMPNGSSATYTIECTVDPSATGTLSYTAIVAASTVDPNLGDTTATDSDTITPGVDLGVAIDRAEPIVSGGETAFTVTLSNLGATNFMDVTGVALAVDFDAPASCSWGSEATGSASGNTASGTGSISESGLTLPTGAAIRYNVACAIDIGASGNFTTTATLTAPGDANPANNTAVDSTPIIGADLELGLTNGTGSVVAGGTSVHGLLVTNQGPGYSGEALLEVDLLSAADSCRWWSAAEGSVTGTSSGNGRRIADTLTLAAGSSAFYVVSCSVPPEATGSFEVVATIDSAADPDTTDNSLNDSDSIVRFSDRETLVLTHFGRMLTEADLSFDDFEQLLVRLHDLASHSKVRGMLLDLGHSSELAEHYATWDADVELRGGRPDFANRVLFGCDVSECNGNPGKGLHGLIADQRREQHHIAHLLIVGDDRVVPMARVPDYTGYPSEIDYVGGGTVAGLTATSTTVGQALAGGFFLTDDPLAVTRPLGSRDLVDHRKAFLPDLGVGRLVESPFEITTALEIFIDRDGVIDLDQHNRRVLVTGYDFLIDSSTRIRDRWSLAYGQPLGSTSLVPVDGQLIGRDWGLPNADDRADALSDHLGGLGAGPYTVMSLNGHATHFDEGVPGASYTDIRGLSSARIASLDLEGTLAYAVGCHGGLPVAGRQATAADHPLDLPQTFIRTGSLAYIANSGFGWGLVHAVGYSERLVDLFTSEVISNRVISVGEAIRSAKRRYFFEDPRLGIYDAKTLAQWTLFGFPMAEIDTGLAASSPLSTGPDAPRNDDVSPCELSSSLPTGMTCELTKLTFSESDTFEKFTAVGDPVSDDVEGCPAPRDGEPAGCFYTLNGLHSTEGDLPIEPMLILEDRLSGASQHGVLWKGAEYREETLWTPVFAQLVSNGGETPLPGPLPRTTFILPRRAGGGLGALANEAECRDADSEPNRIIYTPAELIFDDALEPTKHRIHYHLELERFYLARDEETNCDRTGPVIADGPLHSVAANTVQWSIAAQDAEGTVWRVVVVWDDDENDRWRSVELDYDAASGRWHGTATVPNESRRVPYFVQAVDDRGNVSWVGYQPPAPSASGIDLALPMPFEAVVPPPSALIFADGFESGSCAEWSGCT